MMNNHESTLDQRLENAKDKCRGVAAEIGKREAILPKLKNARDEFSALRLKHEQSIGVARAEHDLARDAWLLTQQVGPEPRFDEPAVAGSPFETLSAAQDMEAQTIADISRTTNTIAELRRALKEAEDHLDKVVDEKARAQAAALRPVILKAIRELQRLACDFPLQSDMHRPVNRIALTAEDAIINKVLLAALEHSDPWSKPINLPDPYDVSAARQEQIRRELRNYTEQD